jgi:uncharacterized protein (DUF1800 family)
MASEIDLAHLARRVGFGEKLPVLRALPNLTREQMADQWLDAAFYAPRAARPSLLDSGDNEWVKTVKLRAWWYDLMSSTSTPLVEKMTLFWHGHFCSNHDKVVYADHLWEQNDLFRRLGLGNVRQLTQQMAVQPAMLRYLDNMTNVKGTPNENFARELWELFLLGPTGYSQQDVAASARAWTGYGITKVNGKERHVYSAAQHDERPAAIFGTTKSWRGREVIDATLDHPVVGRLAARWLCRKWWEYFAHANPTDAVLDELATVLITNRWEITPTLRALFRHREFWSATARHGRVKSPAEYVVSIARALGIKATALQPDWYAGQMGQELFNPPDVSGWRHNDGWLSSGAYWGRASISDIAVSVLFAEQAHNGRFKGLDLRRSSGPIDELAAYFGIAPATLSTATRNSLAQWRTEQIAAESTEKAWGGFLLLNMVKLILLSPEFQMN